MTDTVTPLIQNFSLVAGDAKEIDVDIGPDTGVSLLGSDIIWNVYRQKYGIYYGDPILTKRLDAGLQIIDPTHLLVVITIDEADTIDLVGNYYHELTVIDGDGNRATTTQGIVTIKATANR